MVEQFEMYLESKGKSINTIKSYVQHVKGYIKWFESNKQMAFSMLYEDNVREFVLYLQRINQMPSTINAKVNALVSFNECLIETGVQGHMLSYDSMYMRVQQQYASLSTVDVTDVERFRQVVLESGSRRDYTLVTLLAYGGLRISEALDIRMEDIHISTGEIVVRGKGNKQRIILMSGKVKDNLLLWMEERDDDKEYLFYSRQSERMNRTTINNLFKKFNDTHPTPDGNLKNPQFSNLKKYPNFHKSEKENKKYPNLQESALPLQSPITPHTLRHFYCSHALESGMSIQAVANQAGHSNIQTTMLYAHPSRQDILDSLNKM